MKKVKLLLLSLFLISSLFGQDVKMFGSIDSSDFGEKESFMINDNVSVGLYFENSDKIVMQSIYLNIGEDGIGKSFIIRVLSAPEMKNGKMYKNSNNFKSLCSSDIICRADKKGILKLNISDKDIIADGNFILKFERQEDDTNPTIVEEDKMSIDGRSIDGKKKTNYYGPSICIYNKQLDNIYQLIYLKRSDTFAVFRNSNDLVQGIAVECVKIKL